MNHSSIEHSNHMSHDTHHHHPHHNHHSVDVSTVKLNTMATTLHHQPSHSHDSTMKMYFHLGFTETILFEQWITTSTFIFICSWIFIFILGILYEGIREIRQYLEEKQLIDRSIISSEGNETELECMNTESTPRIEKKVPPKFAIRALYSVLYAVHLILGYSLMLIAMTFNAYLFFAIIFGVGTGHLLYTWCRLIPLTNKKQHCTK